MTEARATYAFALAALEEGQIELAKTALSIALAATDPQPEVSNDDGVHMVLTRHDYGALPPATAKAIGILALGCVSTPALAYSASPMVASAEGVVGVAIAALMIGVLAGVAIGSSFLHRETPHE